MRRVIRTKCSRDALNLENIHNFMVAYGLQPQRRAV